MRFGETRTHIDKHTMKLAKLLLTALLLPSVMTVQAVGNNDDQDYEAGLRLLDQGQYMDALKSFGRSAKNGNTDAQYQIGIMFLEGEGMKANPEDAAYWFRKAAQNGPCPVPVRDRTLLPDRHGRAGRRAHGRRMVLARRRTGRP